LKRRRFPVRPGHTPILETERLKLCELSQDDLDDLAAMVADEDQTTTLP